jgi:type II secretion system protein N
MIALNGGDATIESFTLQGDGLYVRLKGNIRPGPSLAAAPLEITMELMPKPDFLEKQKFVFLLLAKYLDTPGHYRIPVRGSLGKPVME